MDTHATTPDFLSVSLMLKATPQIEDGQRVLYCEASNETVDAQNEVILQKALADSMEYMLARGNFDIDHVTMTGAKLGISDYLMYEIGRPTDIRFRDKRTFVKGVIYQGEGPAAERANQFWSSLTEINPPARWYPSVGGAVQARAEDLDPATRSVVTRITKCRWSNIGFSKQPVNQHVAQVQTIPMEAFAKSWGAQGLALTKALEAGYGTSPEALTGSGPLRVQSLQGSPLTYEQSSHFLAEALVRGSVGINPTSSDLQRLLIESRGLSAATAAAHVGRFMRGLALKLKRKPQ